MQRVGWIVLVLGVVIFALGIPIGGPQNSPFWIGIVLALVGTGIVIAARRRAPN